MTTRSRFSALWLASLLVLLGGCSGLPSVAQRLEHADALAAAHGWQPITLDTGPFQLRAYGPPGRASMGEAVVYIEGDGLAWLTRSRPSTDPTPVHPTGLQLALAHPDSHALYLARPCQYQPDPACAPPYWLGKRFAPEVIEATLQALDRLKARYGARSLVLVGYSGGAAVAALAAARREDVSALITVAGNLDTALWARLHGISPLSGSLNPADQTQALQDLPQWHFVGARDEIVPSAIATACAPASPHRRR